ncbi:MAG: hypothetical protein ACPL7R_02230 [Anaerolineae bacterium]
MDVSAETTRLTLLVTQALERLGIRYAVAGSLASSLYGVMRSTLDVNIVADVRPEHIPGLVATLSDEFYVDDEMVRTAIEQRTSFNLIHYQTAFKVDIFICGSRPFDQVQLERRRPLAITTKREQCVYVISPEDTILAKLARYRMGGEVSNLQWRDVLGVLKTRAGELDLDYLREWASELHVSDLLERALEEAR